MFNKKVIGGKKSPNQLSPGAIKKIKEISLITFVSF